MRRNYGSFRNSGAYTSPGTPEHCEQTGNEIIPKTWSSERVPLPGSNGRRPITAAALMPFNTSGRTLPSKWDDAERWITSPFSGYGGFRFQPQRHAKSKSGPLGPTGVVYNGNYKNYMVNSPLTTGVLVPDGLSVHYEAGIAARTNFSFDESSISRSTGVLGLNDLINETSMPNSPGGEMINDNDREVAVLCRDVATQMSPDGSERLSFSNLACTVSMDERSGEKDEIRDVQVDRGTTTSKKRMNKSFEDLPSSAWTVSEASKNISKVEREELKITAWENLQKAKAEAAIRKLEMKLEKKRSASIDKITNKLRAAQMKALAMRDSISEQSPRRRVKIISFSPCFLCSRTFREK